MTQPNPTIDLAKARAYWDALQKAYEVVPDFQLATWATEFGPTLLTALEQMQAEARYLRQFLQQFADSQEPLGAEFEKILNDNIEKLYEP